nr:putative ribonuclease H-like domain-containing protein [Tanacetum cinerariifolium]
NFFFFLHLSSSWFPYDLCYDGNDDPNNKTDLEEQSRDDLFNSLKIYEAKVKSSSSTSTTTQNIAFVSTSNTDSTNEPVRAAASFSAIDADDLEEMDLKWYSVTTVTRRDTLQGSVEEEPTNYALMAFSSLSSSSDNDVVSCSKACLESVEARLLVYQQNESVFEEDIKLHKLEVQLRYNALVSLRQNLEKAKQERDDLKLKSDESLSPSPDLVFNTAPNAVETDHPAFTVKLSPTKPDQDLSHTNRPSAPIIEDWVYDSEDESETKTPQNVPSFVQPSEQVKSPRPSVQHVETSIPTMTTILKPTSNGKRRNKKACFVEMGMETKMPNFRPCFPYHKCINDLKKGNPQHALKDKGVIDSGYSRHMIGNMSYLYNFEELNGGYVAFGGNPKGGKILRKGKIRTGKLDFDNVYFIKELKFNIFSVSQMSEKKNSVLFIDTKCLVLSLEFKQPEENQVLLRVPRENNINLSAMFEDYSDNIINEDNAAGTLVPAIGQISPNSTNNFSADELEDITYSDNEDDVGAEVDFNNLETFITVSPIPTTRVHKDYHVTQIIGDLSSATQTRSMTRVAKDQGGLSQMFNDDFHTCMFACFISQEEPKREDGIDDEEVFAPVARIEAIRLFLAYASFMGFMVYQMDVKSAFLYETIEEEVYVCQPLGFEDLDYPDKVYKVVKVLYGLHQALRAWYETLANYLLEYGFQRGKIDQTLFIKREKGDILLVQIYVDDIIFASTNKDLCKAFEKLMKEKFQMSSMGELTFFLGLQVKQKKDGIFISQDKYVAKILRKFGLTDGKSASTPIDIEKPLLKDPDGEDVDVHTYISMIGPLMYLTSLRPDIMFAVCACAHFQVTPKASHLHAVKRIFRYLKGKPHLGLWYPKDLPFDLVAYSGSDYVGASLDRKSTTGGCQFLGCRLISWQCKKQTVFATSSTEAKYVVVASCCIQMLWIQNQLLDYSSIKYALTVNPNIYVSCIKQFWTFIAIKKVNDVTRLQALVDKKKVVITKASIRDALRLDDAEGVECLPNKEIFTELARMGYEKPSTKLTFYKAFFSSQKQVGDPSSHSTKYTSPALTQKVVEGVDEVHDEGVSAASIVVEGDVSAANDEVPTVDEEPSISSPTPPTPPLQPSQDVPSTSQDAGILIDILQNLMDTCTTLTRSVEHLEHDKVAQSLEITKLNSRVKKLERRNKASNVKRLKKGMTAESQAQIYKIDLEHVNKVLSMQDEEESEPIELQEVVDVVTTAKIITEVVTAASTTITAADVPIPAATTSVASTLTADPSRKTNEEVIRDPEESTTTSIIIYSEAKSKDKECCWFKMDYFKGMTYVDIRLIFEKHFDSNVAFLQKTKEQMDEEDSRALNRLNESKEEKAAKKQKLGEEVDKLKRHLHIVLNDDDDDVYT